MRDTGQCACAPRPQTLYTPQPAVWLYNTRDAARGVAGDEGAGVERRATPRTAEDVHVPEAGSGSSAAGRGTPERARAEADTIPHPRARATHCTCMASPTPPSASVAGGSPNHPGSAPPSARERQRADLAAYRQMAAAADGIRDVPAYRGNSRCLMPQTHREETQYLRTARLAHVSNILTGADPQ